MTLPRRIEQRPRAELGGDRAARELEHRRDLGALGRAEALDPLQLLGLGAQQAGEAAEAAEQLLGELKDAGADQAGAQQQRDQLGVGERRRPQGEQLFARPGRSGNVLEHGGSSRRQRPRLVKCRSSLSPAKAHALNARRARLLPDLALPASRRRRRRLRRHLRRRRRRRCRSAPASSRRRWRRACSAWPRAARNRSRSPPAKRSASATRRWCSASAAPCSTPKAMPTATTASATSSASRARRPVDRRRRARGRRRRAACSTSTTRSPAAPVTFDVKLIGVVVMLCRCPSRQPGRGRELRVVLAEPRGFCAGVDRAIEIVERALAQVRRADLRAPRDRPQHLRRRRPEDEGRDLHRGPRRRAARRDARLQRPRRVAGGAQGSGGARLLRSSMRPARSSTRSTSRSRSSRAKATTSS